MKQGRKRDKEKVESKERNMGKEEVKNKDTEREGKNRYEENMVSN